jgi:hypothetical protein
MSAQKTLGIKIVAATAGEKSRGGFDRIIYQEPTARHLEQGRLRTPKISIEASQRRV